MAIAIASRAERAARALQPGHGVKLLAGGAAYFDALIEAIDAARVEVLLETYILDFAGRPGEVAEAIGRAAARGVCVRVVVDGFGTGELPPEWQARWKDAGVAWRVFNPVGGWRMLLPKGWRRLHRKLCVVDGTVAFCGGINLLDDFHDPNHGALDEPRFDFAVRVSGPLVADAHETMVRLWLRLQVAREAKQPDVAGALEAVRRAARAGTDADAPRVSSDDFRADTREPHAGLFAGLLLRDNVRFRKRIEHFYRYAINQAEREITIANAYFVPGLALQRALLRARKRGVKITLLLQGRYEYFMQHHTTRALYGVLLDAGIEIVEYAPSFLHAKVAVFDSPRGAIATVGSSNLDPISLLLAREANVFVRDDAFAAELKASLDAALAAGKRIGSKAYLARSFRGRALSWLAYAGMRIALFATRHRY